MNNQWIVVLGRNYTSRLGMIRATGMAGYDIAVVKTDKREKYASKPEKIDASSRFVKKYFCVKEKNDSQIIKLLKDEFAGCSPRPILLPTDDYTAALIDMNINVLKEDFLFPGIGMEQGKVVSYMDKSIQKKIAQSCGLAVAKGLEAFCENGTYVLPEDITYPCFIKPEVSFLGDKQFMKKCENEKELVSALSDVANRTNCKVLIEEYINIEKEFDIPGLSLREKAFLPGIIEKGIIFLGVTGTGVIKPIETYPGIQEKLSAFLKKIGFTGLVDIEMFASNGKIYFNELNLRFGASGFAMTGNGINLPAMFISHILGNTLYAESEKRVKEAFFASEKVCLQAYTNDRLSWSEYKEIMRKTDYQFIHYLDDMKPYRVFSHTLYRNHVKKAILGR